MQPTIANTLSQGVSAHQEGRHQEAERCYRTILASHPDHADANHNLGVLAVSFNQTEFALPFFKKALDTNPKIEQFWLSYKGATTLLLVPNINSTAAIFVSSSVCPQSRCV